METCVRGFSFMSDTKIDLPNLQYIEQGELERTWKQTRRERMKEREQKIWDDFVKEKNVLDSVCKEDPYQFLDQLPEGCLKELMEIELEKMKKQVVPEESPPVREVLEPEEVAEPCTVTFADVLDRESEELFHILADQDDEHSGEEKTVYDSSLCSPDTVRGAGSPTERGLLSRDSPSVHDGQSPVPGELRSRPTSSRLGNCTTISTSSPSINNKSKSAENVSNMIESSIYCARVKDLRQGIDEELHNMISSLECCAILSCDPEEVPRIIKRSAEFCGRFNRIYMYQLQRQMHDVKRNNSLTLPFAKHTQFQAQMVRVVSLHQSMLQALQVFHKSWEQTRCVRESSAALSALLTAVHDATMLCAEIPAPKDFAAASELYNDDIIPTCDKFAQYIADYNLRCEDFLNTYERQSPRKGKMPKASKRSSPSSNRSGSKAGMEGRLSMYSMDKMRINLHSKPTTTKEGQSVAGKGCSTRRTPKSKSKNQKEYNEETPKAVKNHRRPLMRDPHAGHNKTKPTNTQKDKDTDVPTMVETVALDPGLTSSFQQRTSNQGLLYSKIVNKSPTNLKPPSYASNPISREQTPPPRRTVAPPPTNKARSKTGHLSTKASPRTPRGRPVRRSESPKSAYSVNISEDTYNAYHDVLTPVCKIQCAIKQKNIELKPIADQKSEKPPPSPVTPHSKRSDTTQKQVLSPSSNNCEVTKLLTELCNKETPPSTERVSGSKNAKLVCMYDGSTRQPSTPQLLRILEESIQKKLPKHLKTRDPESLRLTFNIPEQTTDALFQYRTKFVQHMLTSPMYANSEVGKPWEMIGSVSEQLIDEVLQSCVKDMEIEDIVKEIYRRETT